MAIHDYCSCCRKEREEDDLQPRKLERLPMDIVNDKLFERKGLPVRVCPYCDGDALEEALKAHEQRA